MKTEFPMCCGKQMKPTLELGRFTEAKCENCGDVVYIKKYSETRPVLLDD